MKLRKTWDCEHYGPPQIYGVCAVCLRHNLHLQIAEVDAAISDQQ